MEEVAADDDIEEGAAAAGAPKRPTQAQVVDLLRKMSGDPSWAPLRVRESEPGYVYCSWCAVSIRGWKNDLLKHLSSQRHQNRQNGAIHQYLRPLTSNKRTAAEILSPPDDEFLARLLIHVEGSGISYYSFHRLMTPAFRELISKHHAPFPSSAHMRSAIFPTSVRIVTETVDETVGNSPFSLLVDESPENSQQPFILISIATASAFMALHCKVLETHETMTSEYIRDTVLRVLHERGYSLNNFIAYVADNTSYAKKAYRLLSTAESLQHLKHIGCLSHVIHLLAQALFKKERERGQPDHPFFPLVDEIAAHLSSLFAHRDSVGERLRQERFCTAFGRSARALFWQVRGRWAAKLTSILWIAENRLSFLAFLATEIANHPGPASLQDLQELLSSVTARANLTVVKIIAEGLLTFLTQSQSEDVAVSMEVYRKLEAFIAGMREYARDEYAGPLIRQLLSTGLLILDAHASNALTVQFQSSVQSICDKYDKHLSYLQFVYKWFPLVDPASFFLSAGPLPAALVPLTSNFLIAVGEYGVLTHETNPLRAAYLQLPAGERPSVLEFWKKNAQAYPSIAKIAFTLLALRAGIAGVERQFKLLRMIQVPQRVRMRPETLEGNFLIRANVQYVDPYYVQQAEGPDAVADNVDE